MHNGLAVPCLVGARGPYGRHLQRASNTHDGATRLRGIAAFNPSHVGERCIQNMCMHTHDPVVLAPKALDAVVERFAVRGFNLHILRGHELPHSHVLSFRLLNDPNHPMNIMDDACEGGSLASGTAGAGEYADASTI